MNTSCIRIYIMAMFCFVLEHDAHVVLFNESLVLMTCACGVYPSKMCPPKLFPLIKLSNWKQRINVPTQKVSAH